MEQKEQEMEQTKRKRAHRVEHAVSEEQREVVVLVARRNRELLAACGEMT